MKDWTKKEILKLFKLYHEGLSQKDIAKKLKRTIASVRGQLTRCTITGPTKSIMLAKKFKDEVGGKNV